MTAERRAKNQPPVYEATMRLLLAQYAKVFWYMDNSLNSSANRADTTSVLIETAAPILGEYIANNGKLLLTSPFPDNTGRLDRDSPVFGLLPVDSIPFVSNTLRIGNHNPVTSDRPADGYPDLATSSTISGADALFQAISRHSIYSLNHEPGLLPGEE